MPELSHIDPKSTALLVMDYQVDTLTKFMRAAQSADAVMLMDQAGWHLTPKLKVPDNISIVPLPAKSPELTPQENVWQFMRDNWLSNWVFASYDDIVDHCCDAWNKLLDQPWRIMSLGLRR
jgi:transposase